MWLFGRDPSLWNFQQNAPQRCHCLECFDIWVYVRSVFMIPGAFTISMITSENKSLNQSRALFNQQNCIEQTKINLEVDFEDWMYN